MTDGPSSSPFIDMPLTIFLTISMIQKPILIHAFPFHGQARSGPEDSQKPDEHGAKERNEV
ncbi:hypothetical protein K3495_g15868 [Podosphaera aphanis]|nr:hypothetical protein K3495_g15868 [Podosphaera aphanis]